MEKSAPHGRNGFSDTSSPEETDTEPLQLSEAYVHSLASLGLERLQNEPGRLHAEAIAVDEVICFCIVQWDVSVFVGLFSASDVHTCLRDNPPCISFPFISLDLLIPFGLDVLYVHHDGKAQAQTCGSYPHISSPSVNMDRVGNLGVRVIAQGNKPQYARLKR